MTHTTTEPAIDRCASARTDPRALTELCARLAERTLILFDGDIGVTDPLDARLSGLAYVSSEHLPRLKDTPRIFLGTDQQYVYWAIRFEDFIADPTQANPYPGADNDISVSPLNGASIAFKPLRELLPTLAASEAHFVCLARQLLHFQDRHRYCGRCASPTRMGRLGAQVECENPGCESVFFPRIDPAIIVQVTHGDQILLGRQASWPKGRYSTLAGFVEPYETLEAAVVREVFEETSVKVRDPRYVASQPWTFPSNLMLGFTATAMSTEIHCRDNELEDARWFSVADIESAAVSLLPSPVSISYRLINDWYHSHTHRSLESLPGRQPRAG